MGKHGHHTKTDEVFKPSILTVCQESDLHVELPPEQKLLLILDVIRAHTTPPVLQKLADENILTIFVPEN